ncbi:MAG: FAD-dependent oxidoreductase, partial [Negativicutes bacterium]|nr:FAD-dependent oxidoreductase [Negativicutes bacterium]
EIDENLETKIPGLFAIGDGAGITRGLSQASASGVYVARKIGMKATGTKK